MNVVDNRAKTIKRVYEIELGKAFMTNDGSVYIRVDCLDYDIKGLFDDEVPVMNRAGEIIGMNRDIVIEPIKLELWIVD